MNLRLSFFLLCISLFIQSLSMEVDIFSSLRPSLKNKDKEETQYIRSLRNLSSFLKKTEKLQSSCFEVLKLAHKTLNTYFDKFSVFCFYAQALRTPGSTKYTDQGTLFTPTDPQKTATLFPHLLLMTTPEGIAAFNAVLKANKDFISNSKGKISDSTSTTKKQKTLDIATNLITNASNEEVKAAALTLFNRIYLKSLTDIIRELLLLMSPGYMTNFSFDLLLLSSNKSIKLEMETDLQQQRIFKFVTANLPCIIKAAEALENCHDLLIRNDAQALMVEATLKDAVDIWNLQERPFQAPEYPKGMGLELANQIKNQIENSTRSLLNAASKRKEIANKIDLKLAALTSPATSVVIAAPPSPSPRSKKKKKRKQPPISSSASISSPLVPTPSKDISLAASDSGSSALSAASASNNNELLSLNIQKLKNTPCVKSNRKFLNYAESVVSKYDKRIFYYLINAQPETFTARNPISFQHYHAFNPLADQFLRQYGQQTKRANNTHRGQIDTIFSLNGIISYHDGSQRLVKFSSTENQNKEIYHREIKERKNINKLSSNNASSTISEYQQDNLEELSEEKQVNIYIRFNNVKNPTSQTASYKETPQTIVIKDKVHHCTYYLFKPILEDNTESS